jgi:hypothetical protein
MKLTIGLMLAIVFSMTVWMPADTSAQTLRIRTYRTYPTYEQRERMRHRRWRARMYRNTYGYPNYGMYRRNEVGNRGFRLERQTYYVNGRRYTRTIRIY